MSSFIYAGILREAKEAVISEVFLPDSTSRIMLSIQCCKVKNPEFINLSEFVKDCLN